MSLIEILGDNEMLHVFKYLSRRKLVALAFSGRRFAKLSARATSVHVIWNINGAVGLLRGHQSEDDKQMFLALQNALQYEDTRKHYRIVGRIIPGHMFLEPQVKCSSQDEALFIRQCLPLMSAGLRIMTGTDARNEEWVTSMLDLFQGACTEVCTIWLCHGEHLDRMLTNPTVLAARKLIIYRHIEEQPNSAELLINWLWHAHECGLQGGNGLMMPRKLALQLDYAVEIVEHFAKMLKQKFKFALENNALPLPNFLLHFTHFDWGDNIDIDISSSPMRQIFIESLEKIVDYGQNVVAKFDFIHCPTDNPEKFSWIIRQFYGAMEDINFEQQRKIGEPVILRL